MIGYNGFVDLFRKPQKQGVAELQIEKGFTAEEEDIQSDDIQSIPRNATIRMENYDVSQTI